jgi:hypothetical protein
LLHAAALALRSQLGDKTSGLDEREQVLIRLVFRGDSADDAASTGLRPIGFCVPVALTLKPPGDA